LFVLILADESKRNLTLIKQRTEMESSSQSFHVLTNHICNLRPLDQEKEKLKEKEKETKKQRKKTKEKKGRQERRKEERIVPV
jgi:HD-like signal output (HDOD) protein